MMHGSHDWSRQRTQWVSSCCWLRYESASLRREVGADASLPRGHFALPSFSSHKSQAKRTVVRQPTHPDPCTAHSRAPPPGTWHTLQTPTLQTPPSTTKAVRKVGPGPCVSRASVSMSFASRPSPGHPLSIPNTQNNMPTPRKLGKWSTPGASGIDVELKVVELCNLEVAR
eukprot:scaffold29_cov251-Pinguiococcus_pyrenoidosus.AAC.7